MKKQIIFPGFIYRLLGSTLDLMLITTLISPILQYISKLIWILVFRDFISLHVVDMLNFHDVAKISISKDFFDYIQAGNFSKYFLYFGLVSILNVLFLGAFFVGFWYKFGATPGKMLLKIQIIDQDTMLKPTLYQLIKRFLGYSLVLIGIWFIIFTKRSQALHDKIAKTLVIKV
jgi:uncharacterized RDD family membrane protein YckC